jgi:hypothetical protein
MQQHNHDRRVMGIRRVPVERIVDVCGSAAPPLAFQCRSVDISGRGMQLRASFVPDLGATLVLRFQEPGGEVIAEGEVAWRKEMTRGGEFGVRFTALDSRSVQALKALCRVDADVEIAAGSRPAELADPEENVQDTDPAPATAPAVRLHIAGLNAPMQARVRQQGRQTLEVGSRLEFLRIGRSLHIEDPALGARREACIEAVEVSVDHESRIPELIVSVRYADVAETPRPVSSRARAAPVSAPVTRRSPPAPAPQPELANPEPREQAEPPELDWGNDGEGSELASSEQEGEDEKASLPPPVRDRQSQDGVQAAPDFDTESPFEGDHPFDGERLRERMDGVLSGVSVAARAAAEQCVRFGGVASRSASWLVARARGVRLAAAAARPTAPRRRTAAPPRSALRATSARQQPRLAASSGRASREEQASSSPRAARLAALGCLLAITALVGIMLGRGGHKPDNAAVVPSAAASRATAPAASAPRVDPTPPAAASPSSPRPTAPSRVLGPADDGDVDDGAPAGSLAQLSPPGPSSPDTEDSSSFEARALAHTKVADQAFTDSPPSTLRPRAVTPNEFGSGRLERPVIYRLRLDQPGGNLRGERTAMGFDVIIEGRKTMESAVGIAQRDDRIAKVLTRNGSDGARVSFRFRRAVPGYKVRLRKDFVEFFISSS